MKKKSKIYIGIDPAFRKDGFCICIIDKADNTARFVTFEDFLAFSSWFQHEAPEAAIFCVENSNLQNKNFAVTAEFVYNFFSKSLFLKITSALQLILKFARICARKGRDVGKNQAISQCTVDLVKSRFPVIDCSPKDKGKKWNNREFLAVAKQEKIILPNQALKNYRSSQDERDSFKLALMAKNKYYLAFKC